MKKYVVNNFKVFLIMLKNNDIIATFFLGGGEDEIEFTAILFFLGGGLCI